MVPVAAWFTMAIACGGLMSGAGSQGSGPRSPNPGPRKTVLEILTDDALWGKGFPAVLAQIEGFPQAGERRIAVFRDKVVGEKAFKAKPEAEAAARQLDSTLARVRQAPTPLSRMLSARTSAQPAELKAAARYFSDDESTRVTVDSPDLLAPGLTLSTVKERLGAPERVKKELIQGEGERRPTILTVYQYAGGAVAFAESDIATRPGLVDRVLIEVPAATESLSRDVR